MIVKAVKFLHGTGGHNTAFDVQKRYQLPDCGNFVVFAVHSTLPRHHTTFRQLRAGGKVLIAALLLSQDMRYTVTNVHKRNPGTQELSGRKRKAGAGDMGQGF
jgi:hypothetical protein